MTKTVPRVQTPPTDRRDGALIQAGGPVERGTLGPTAFQRLTGQGTDALIKEARRLRRRRWYFGSALTALLIAVAVAGYLIVSGPPAGAARSTRHHDEASRGATGSASVPTRSPDLIQPTTLATLPDGDLLILDSSRDQILELRPDGNLTVFAGNGRLGFSGDGGPARAAELDFGYFSSAAWPVTPNGSVDFLDDGNCRVRQVAPDGVIHTLARIPVVKVMGAPAERRARLTPSRYLPKARHSSPPVQGSSNVCASGGRLVWVAGSKGDEPHAANPTPSTVVFAPDSLAFNRRLGTTTSAATRQARLPARPLRQAHRAPRRQLPQRGGHRTERQRRRRHTSA